MVALVIPKPTQEPIAISQVRASGPAIREVLMPMGKMSHHFHRQPRQMNHRHAEDDTEALLLTMLVQKVAQGNALGFRKELAAIAIPRRARGPQVHYKHAQMAVGNGIMEGLRERLVPGKHSRALIIIISGASPFANGVPRRC